MVVKLEEEAHLNTSFKHFSFFINEFSLIATRELAPLADLIARNMQKAGLEGASPGSRPVKSRALAMHIES